MFFYSRFVKKLEDPKSGIDTAQLSPGALEVVERIKKMPLKKLINLDLSENSVTSTYMRHANTKYYKIILDIFRKRQEKAKEFIRYAIGRNLKVITRKIDWCRSKLRKLMKGYGKKNFFEKMELRKKIIHLGDKLKKHRIFYKKMQLNFAEDPRLQSVMQIDESWIPGNSIEQKYESMIRVARKLWYQKKTINRTNVESARNEIFSEFQTHARMPLIKGRIVFHLLAEVRDPFATNKHKVKKAVNKKGGDLPDEYNVKPERTYASVSGIKKRYLNFLRYQKGNIASIINLHGGRNSLSIINHSPAKISGKESYALKAKAIKITYNEIAQALIDRKKHVPHDYYPPVFLMNNCNSNEFGRRILAAIKRKAPGVVIAGTSESGQLGWNSGTFISSRAKTLGDLWELERDYSYGNITVIIQTRTGKTTQVVENSEVRNSTKRRAPSRPVKRGSHKV